MKLPKEEEKFTVCMPCGEECYRFNSYVVSGIHIEIRYQDEDSVWFYVCADKVEDDFFHGVFLYVALALTGDSRVQTGPHLLPDIILDTFFTNQGV